MSASAYNIRKARRERQDLKRFDALVASPTSLGNVAADGTSSTFQLPGNAYLAIACDAALDAGDLTVDVGSHAFGIPNLSADEIHQVGWGEKDRVVSISRGSSAPAGAVTLYIVNSFGMPIQIATATFT